MKKSTIDRSINELRWLVKRHTAGMAVLLIVSIAILTSGNAIASGKPTVGIGLSEDKSAKEAGRQAALQAKGETDGAPSIVVIYAATSERDKLEAIIDGVATVFDRKLCYGCSATGVMAKGRVATAGSVAVMTLRLPKPAVALLIEQCRADFAAAGVQAAKKLKADGVDKNDLVIIHGDLAAPEKAGSAKFVEALVSALPEGIVPFGAFAPRPEDKPGLIIHGGRVISDAVSLLVLSGLDRFAHAGEANKPGESDRFYASASRAARGVRCKVGPAPSLLWIMNCSSRLETLAGRNQLDPEPNAIREVFGAVPFFGLYGWGEIGCKLRSNTTGSHAGHIIIAGIGLEPEKSAPSYEFVKCGPIPLRENGGPSVWSGIGCDAKGRVVMAVGNHRDDVFFYIWEPGLKEGKRIARFQDIVREGKREYGSGKVHHHLYLGPEGKLWFATMSGNYGKECRTYPGTHFMSLDTDTNELKDYGIAYTNDSIIGAEMDNERGKFYGVTMYDGHLIECDIKTGKFRDLGLTGGSGTRGIFIDAWHRVYFPAIDGTMRRYDPKTEQMADVPLAIPKDREWHSIIPMAHRKEFYIVIGWNKDWLIRYRADEGFGRFDDLSSAIKCADMFPSNLGIGRNGKLYNVNSHGRLIQIDPKALTWNDLGRILPPGASNYEGFVTGTDWVADDTFYATWHQPGEQGAAAILIIRTTE